MVTSRQQGEYTEQLACDYLQQQGLRLVEKNFNCKCGEIDLIMQHNDSLVFVEVRYRRNNDYGSAAESVTRNKQQKLLNSAAFYLQKNPAFNNRPARFDIVSITGPLQQANIDINWIENAFTA